MGITRFDIVKANDFIGGQPGRTGGVTFYVNNATVGIQEFAIGGSDGNSGRSPEEPFATIQKAIDSSVSGRGDRIIVYPGTYPENLNIVGKSYLTIQGAFEAGYTRPDVIPAGGRALTVSYSQGLVLRNMRFVSLETDSVLQTGNGFLFQNCVFDGSVGQPITAANLRLMGVSDPDDFTASEGRIVDCLFRDGGGVGLVFQHAELPSGVGVTDVEVLNSRFYANTSFDISTQANISGGGAGIVQNLKLNNCDFMTPDKAVYVDLNQPSFAGGDVALNTGIIADCNFNSIATLTNVIIAIGGTNIHMVGGKSAKGITDASAF